MGQNSRRDFLCTMGSLLLAPWILKEGHCAVGPSRKPDHVAQRKERTQEKNTFVDEPSYVSLQRKGLLRERGQQLWEIMKRCRLCPRQCGADRISGQRGFCQSTAKLEIASYHAHFGEERPLVGRGGSGTIFLSHCSLRCVFCINWDVSQGGMGKAADIEELAGMMTALQKRGCHNINVVTPTHYSPHILLALDRASQMGLRLPLVYNTCGWESPDVLKMLDGVVDIYLPDFKYGSAEAADKYSSGARSYPDVTQVAFLEMQRQVGTAKPGTDGLMHRGLMIRHLVMPNRVADSKNVIRWIADHLPKDSYLNLMSQYVPVFKAHEHPEIARRITYSEYNEVIRWARDAGLTNVHTQGMFHLS